MAKKKTNQAIEQDAGPGNDPVEREVEQMFEEPIPETLNATGEDTVTVTELAIAPDGQPALVETPAQVVDAAALEAQSKRRVEAFKDDLYKVCIKHRFTIEAGAVRDIEPESRVKRARSASAFVERLG